jgi:PAS domain S-box-containing protein
MIADEEASTLTLDLAERLLARSNEGMMAFDRRFRCVHWNALMERLTGLRASDVIGQDLLTLFPFLVEIGEDAYLRRALEGEEVATSHRLYWIPGTNRRGFFDGSYAPLRDRRGEITGGIGVIRDVTESIRAAEILGETENRFRNMADVAPVLLWMADPDGMCSFFNQTWLEFTGRSNDEEWGVGWAAGVHFEDFQRCMDTYVEAFNQRRQFEMEYRLRRHDGEFRWLLDRGTPRYTPDRSFAGYIGSCIDITERRALEGELRRAVRARDEFLSVASHELKTPLTSLQLQIEGLSRNLERRADTALRESRLLAGAKAVTQQARRLSDLIEVLLDVSRINSGRLRFDYTELDFGDVLRDAIDRWRPAAAQANSDINFELAAEAQAAELSGTWDRVRLEQILNNLLSNAVKYGPGKPIRIGLEGGPQQIRFSVADQGIGIPAIDQPRIFQRFERAVPSRNYGGLGLGLWITHEIVTALGGSINVESEPGRGSIFSVALPRHPPPAALPVD